MVLGDQAAVTNKRQAAVWQDQAFLPVPSVTTTALLHLLGMWSSATTQLGGLRRHLHRQAAKQLLASLVRLGFAVARRA